MTLVAVLNRTPGLDDGVVAYWSDAWNSQAQQAAGLWGVLFTPVVFFTTAADLPSDCRILTILPSIDAPGALGYHDYEVGKVFAEVKYTGDDTSVTGSHEVLEEMIDPQCNRWAPYDKDHEQAVEGCDRVEGDAYVVTATVAGVTRPVRVSNYLLPRAFGEDDNGSYDYLGLVDSSTAIRPGGYVILRDITTGKVGNVFARTAHPVARTLAGGGGPSFEAKLTNRRSRLLRRLRAAG